MNDTFIDSLFRETSSERSGDPLLGPPRRPINRDDVKPADIDSWPAYRKVVPTKAVRVGGPFTVQTSEGLLSCSDGWLCVDARGYPYPVADEEFRRIYERLDDRKAGELGPNPMSAKAAAEPAQKSDLARRSEQARMVALTQLERIAEEETADVDDRLAAAQSILIHTQPEIASLFGPFRIPA